MRSKKFIPSGSPAASLLLLFFLISCNAPNADIERIYKLYGKTMGTSYSIIFSADNTTVKANQNLQSSIDSLLIDFDFIASTYNTKSQISTFNASVQTSISKNHFLYLLERSKKIFQETDQAFDPTILPLINFYDFGYEKIEYKRSDLDSVKALVGFDKISWSAVNDSFLVQKQNPKMKLDFNAIAKGYGVDLVGELLESKNISNYLIEIGGEMRARGQKPDNTNWKVSIVRPEESKDKKQQFAGLKLINQSLATSGNYRNFKVVDGKKIGHTINPQTGEPEISNLLSASIITKNCADADAYATACMVMGLEKAKAFVQKQKLTAMFIFSNDQNEFEVWETEGIDRLF